MKLFVGGLHYDITEQQVREMFMQWGNVTECKLAVDRDQNNRSKGFAFVTMPISTEAENAMLQISGNKVNGRTIRVEPANNQEDRRRPLFDSRGARR